MSNRGVFPFPTLGQESALAAQWFIIGRFRVEHEGVTRFSFDGIPQIYNHLRVTSVFRSTSTVPPFGPLYAQFNNDTAAVYGYQEVYAQNSSSAAAGFQENGITANIWGYGGTTATPAIVCVSDAFIPFYRNTTFPKRYTVTYAYQRTIIVSSSYWDRTDAIQSIQLSTSTAGGNSFWIGSEFILYAGF
ncbi:MAG: hypothetical protein RML32_08315 [Gammaproteobacteria bacterium]|nr:hypothetical protein [Gammaproteobacteria bacterium]